MSQFLGTHLNRLDAKGRVSVPAPFRAALKAKEADGGLILRPSHRNACIEAWPAATFAALAAPMQSLELFSENHDDMAATLYSDAYPAEADKEGRIVLPEALIAHAKLSESVAFMGMGQTFFIWEPEAGAAFQRAARERARIQSITLKSGTSAAMAGNA